MSFSRGVASIGCPRAETDQLTFLFILLDTRFVLTFLSTGSISSSSYQNPLIYQFVLAHQLDLFIHTLSHPRNLPHGLDWNSCWTVWLDPAVCSPVRLLLNHVLFFECITVCNNGNHCLPTSVLGSDGICFGLHPSYFEGELQVLFAIWEVVGIRLKKHWSTFQFYSKHY